MYLNKSERDILETSVLNLILNVFSNLNCNQAHTRHVICDFAKEFTHLSEEEIDMLSLGYIKLQHTYLFHRVLDKMRDLNGCIYYKMFR